MQRHQKLISQPVFCPHMSKLPGSRMHVRPTASMRAHNFCQKKTFWNIFLVPMSLHCVQQTHCMPAGNAQQVKGSPTGHTILNSRIARVPRSCTGREEYLQDNTAYIMTSGMNRHTAAKIQADHQIQTRFTVSSTQLALP